MKKSEGSLNSNLYDLHPAQEDVFYEQTLHENTPIHNLGWYTLMEGKVDMAILQQTWQLLYQHVDMLRLCISINSDNEAVQSIQQQHAPEPIILHDFTEQPDPEKKANIWMQQQIAQPINLPNPILYQASLIRVTREKYYFFTKFHHIIMDGVGLFRFHEYVHQLYSCLKNDASTDWLTEIPQYLDSIEKAKEYLSSAGYEKDKNYWYDFLTQKDIHQLTPYYQNNGSGHDTLTLPFSMKKELTDFCKENKTNILTVFSSLVIIMMSALTGQQALTFNTITHGRKTRSEKYVIGMQSNIYPIHCHILDSVSVIEQIKKMELALKKSYSHSQFPHSHLTRLANHHGIALPNIFIFYERLSASAAEIDQAQHHIVDGKFNTDPIVFRLQDFGYYQELTITIDYLQAYFSEQDIKKILKRLQHLLTALLNTPSLSVSELPILLEEERHTLHHWNQTDVPYPQHDLLQQQIERQAAATPDNVALIFEDNTLTYRQLNEQANQLASVIRQCYQQQRNTPMRADTPIALYLDRSLEMVVSLLAVLKAGGAYVPISPEYPPERVQFILEDTGSPCVLTQQNHLITLKKSIRTFAVPPVLIATDDDAITQDQPVENLLPINQSTDLAYIIYTSGTTGQPKGVALTHQNVMNHLCWMQSQYPLHASDNVLQQIPYTFDASVWELLAANGVGATIVMASPDMHKQPEELYQLIQKTGVTVVQFVPSMLGAFCQTIRDVGQQLPATIRYVLCGGEALTMSHVNAFRAINSHASRLINLYGPTETTNDVTHFEVTDELNGNIPIGKPHHNTRMYVLNRDGRLSPIGAPGELYIGGAGLARGYWGRPALTAERFVENPFVTDEDQIQGYTRLYKTGDQVRWLPDGNLEYLGRNDFQVKIRGYRIELGEIETALSAHPQVKHAVVIDREQAGHKALAAYLVTDETLPNDMLIEHLSAHLPEYMIPASFTRIEAIPLTVNGKLDSHALPAPVWEDQNRYIAPRTELEIRLCTLWQDILGIEQIGIEDNFFRMGGDSIISIRLVSRLRQNGFSLQVKSIFEAPTVAQLAQLLSQNSSAVAGVAEQGLLSGEFGLLPVQQAFFNGNRPHSHPRDQTLIMRLPDNIQHTDITRALITLSERHDMLRAHFTDTEQGYRQCYSAEMPAGFPTLRHCDIRKIDKAEQHARLTLWQREGDYRHGPLWQVTQLTGYADGRPRLFFAFHHLIIDATSQRIIANDMRKLLRGETLPAKTSSYRQWVAAVHRYARQHQDEVPYWQKIITEQGTDPAVEEMTVHSLHLSAELTDILRREAHLGYHTNINELLLSALTLALQTTFCRAVNTVTLEGHGREAIDNTLDIAETVGQFTTIYPVCLTMQNDIAETIIHTKEMLRAVPHQGIGYGALHQAGYLTGNLPPIRFNYVDPLNLEQRNLEPLSDQAEFPFSLDGSLPDGTVITDEHHRHFLLNINGEVLSEQLQFRVHSRLSSTQTQTFITAFEQALTRVIAIGQQQAQSGGIKTPSDYAFKAISMERLHRFQQRYQVENLYPATSLQQGFIYHHLTQPQDNAYRGQLLLDYHTHVDLAAYQCAWKLASQRFPILRTAFDWEGDVLQVITADSCIGPENVTIHDIRQLGEAERNNAIAEYLQNDRNQPFDLNQPGLIRLTVFKQHEQQLTVLITQHHCIADGWSGPILLQTVHEYYDQLIKGSEPQIVVEQAYLATQQYHLDHQAESEAYWAERKKGFQGTNDLSTLLSHPIDLTQIKTIEKPAGQRLTLPAEVYQQLKHTCQTQGITLNVALQFAWHKLLHNYTGDEQTIVGTTVSGRDVPVEGIESSVGLYINTLPLTVQWNTANSILAILQDIQKDIAALNSHSAVSLASLQSDGERLFHSLLGFENYPVPAISQNKESIEHALTLRQVVEKLDYPLSLMGYEQDNSFTMKLGYGEDWLTAQQAQRLLSQLERILHTVAYHPQQPHTAIRLLSDEERHTLLHTWNQTDAPYPQDKTLQQLFEAQVEKTPENVAVVFEDETLTYRQLNARANQLAGVIREYYQQNSTAAMQAGTPIALYLDRSLDMVISILAVLKTGGAYVPISPAYPAERIQFILADTATACIVTQQRHFPTLMTTIQALAGAPTLIAADDPIIPPNQPGENPPPINQPTDLAYIIYTSGTTGQPKGVMIEHQNVAHMVSAQANIFHAARRKKALMFAPYVFDGSVFELFSSLLHGLTLYICSEAERNAPAIAKLIQREGIEIAALPPAILKLLMGTALPSLQLLVTAGEAPSADFIDYFSRHSEVLNSYGPTEVTVCATEKRYQHGDIATNIGRAIHNARLYVLDGDGNLSPVGVPGELYIGGAGLARGYLNRPDLTAERFVPNPFATTEDQAKGYTRLYKTGDLVRWLPNGELEYLGRNDFQVKIRGYRIEPGEIEKVLISHPQVKQAVVINHLHQGNNRLVAYLVTADTLSDDTLIAHLSARLPDYMIPASFTRIASVPLTLNGKVDRRALPEPVWGNQRRYVAPRNTLETQLCAIWQAVLGLEQVGIEDNFFRIGGDSVTAIKLTAAIRRDLAIEVSLTQLFKLRTIAALVRHLEPQTGTNIPHHDRDRYPLSFAQERMLFIEQFEQGSDVYHIPYLLQLDNGACLPWLETAINRLVERHPVMKMLYPDDGDGQRYQQLLNRDLVIESSTLSHDDADALMHAIRAEIATPFNLATEPGLRLHHYQIADQHYLFILWHHIAMDGWSIDIFMDELAEIYHSLSEGRDSQLPPLEITYGDYAAWQRAYLQGEVRERQLAYWRQTLANYEPLALPTDYSRPAQVSYQGRDFNFTLDTALSGQLRALAKTQETTLFTVLLSGFYVTLAKLSGQHDIILGTPTDNRHHAQTQSLIGMFVNSLVLRAQLEQTDSVESLIKQTHQLIADAKSHQDMPFEQLVDALEIERDTSRHPIFQVTFSLQRFGERRREQGYLPFRPVALNESLYTPAKFDLSLLLSDEQTHITGCLNYAISLFDETTILRLEDHYQQVLTAFVADQKQPLAGLDTLSAQERHTLLHTWNQTDASYPQDKTLQQLFEAQVDKTPDNIALVYEGATLTYRQLNQRANQLANIIRDRCQQQSPLSMLADTPIALYLDRSLDMVIGILAVLKAGGAYVPVSPEYPAQRVQFILSDTATPCVVTQQRHLSVLTDYAQSLASTPILIATDALTTTAAPWEENPPSVNHPTDLAYIIYTSGTTGQPKGVMIEHKNAIHLITAQAELFEVTKRQKALMFAAYVFDASVSELFTSLLHGLTLYICSEAERNALAIETLIQQAGIEIATLPPALLKLLIGAELPSLQLLVTAGESPSLEVLDYFSQHSDVLNAYGPTEVTVCATGKRYQHGDLATNIGRAINNVRLYVLDEYGNLSPVGAPGELYIGGAGLARGYLNRPELTAERFVPNPFATAEDKANGYTRLYKTGDLVRWRLDGTLEYLGRNDFQIKIRGYRIEPGEIESVLTTHPQVKHAVVIGREHKGNRVLAAYLVAEGSISEETLIEHLSSRLPDYMVPASMTFIEAIPLTLNGKVDHRALPVPEWNKRNHYVAPRNALETQLCAIWQAVLGLEQVGIDDNFFRIGGDSIVSIQLVSRLRQAGFSLQIKSIFEAPTVARLAQLLTQMASSVTMIAEQGLLHGEFALLPVQQHFFNWDLSHPHHWNQALMMQIPGHIRHADITQALITLSERHDMLRTHFVWTENGYRQCYSTEMPSGIPVLQHGDVRAFSKTALHQQLTQWQSGFDYCHGPLWQAGHLTGYRDGSARLFFAFHHLIIDAVSWRIIAEDMRLLLQNKTLPAKTSSYRQWVNAVHHYAQQHQNEVTYWQKVMAGYQAPAASGETSQHSLSISAELTDTLLHEANTGYHTEINDLLLSALTLALQAVFSQSIHHITLEGHGRENIDNTLDISETVGWFTTLYPVRLAMQADIAETIIHTKEMLRAIPNKGIGYGALHQAGYLSDDLPTISFNYLGQLAGTQHQDWSLTSDEAGTVIASENGNHLLLAINGAVQRGRLQFQVDSRLSQSQTTVFITAFEQALHRVITAGYKQAQAGGLKTASDYGINGVSMDQLNQLTQRFGHVNNENSHLHSEKKTILDV
ncbi:putative Phenylalanine racemase (ATP-hydrolyzing) [Xenorhabdus poinarii G6]|uniref:Putative Phenylalanine racemase (ATP-hydrolyzing) n=1 Tax=Xenorhabdus poinarii G6 TaxID=1354304 RepID=A0A068R289_9GAMM|nr:non-ribosomal peptide synthetase [Xenorhabdus poinarii]CDG21268.1 putative Phenylalanine racemase (ATP-hydrolyzing) [Xenorhabdus poinarii G6]